MWVLELGIPTQAKAGNSGSGPSPTVPGHPTADQNTNCPITRNPKDMDYLADFAKAVQIRPTLETK